MSNVLIIEDDKYLLDDLVPLIEFEGHKVTSYFNTEEVLKNMKFFHQYDVIILDIMLLRGPLTVIDSKTETGEVLAEMIREYFDGPIVVISAKEKSEINLNFTGSIKYIKKPLSGDIKEVLELL